MASLSFQRVYDTDVQSPVLAAARDYWRGLAGDREMPSASQIDPLSIPPRVLAHVSLIDVENGAGPVASRRFRFRLIGTYVIETLGRENTGRYFDEVYAPESYEQMTAGLNWLVDHKRPYRSSGSADYAGKGWLDVEFLMLPFAGAAANAATVTRVMMVMDSEALQTGRRVSAGTAGLRTSAGSRFDRR